MDVAETISEADALLPGVPSDGSLDPRWQAIIAVSEFIEPEPEAVWEFIRRWGCNELEDLRVAIATCLLEHLLEHHFAEYFSHVEELAMADELFADTFRRCWQFGQAFEPGNARRFRALVTKLG